MDSWILDSKQLLLSSVVITLWEFFTTSISRPLDYFLELESILFELNSLFYEYIALGLRCYDYLFELFCGSFVMLEPFFVICYIFLSLDVIDSYY